MNLSIRSHHVPICALLVWLATTSASSQGNRPPPARVGSLCRFTLHDYSLSPDSAATINRVVADLLQRHEQAFQFKAPENFRVNIRIFGKKDDYLNYARTNLSVSGAEPRGGPGINTSSLAGYYSADGHEVVTWRQHDPSYLANNILHECSHAILSAQFRYLPSWLSEGCAVYHSYPREVQDANDICSLQYRWLALDDWLKQGQLPALKHFLNLSAKEFRKLEPGQAYTVSWSLFQFLMSTTENRKALTKFVDAIQDIEQEPADCAQALDGAYAGSLKGFERDWKSWIRNGAAKLSPRQPTEPSD